MSRVFWRLCQIRMRSQIHLEIQAESLYLTSCKKLYPRKKQMNQKRRRTHHQGRLWLIIHPINLIQTLQRNHRHQRVVSLPKRTRVANLPRRRNLRKRSQKRTNHQASLKIKLLSPKRKRYRSHRRNQNLQKKQNQRKRDLQRFQKSQSRQERRSHQSPRL